MHITVKNDTGQCVGHACVERQSDWAEIVCEDEQARASLLTMVVALGAKRIYLVRFAGEPEPPKADGWHLINAEVWVNGT